MSAPIVVLTGAGRRGGKRIGDWLADAGWQVVRVGNDLAELEAVDAVVHVDADRLAFEPDGSDPSTTALVERGASVVVYLASPGWDAGATQAWCARREVESIVVDKTRKVHELAPLVRDALS